MTIYLNEKAAALGRLGRTGKFIVLLVAAVAAVFPAQVAAQGGGGMIAYHTCYYSEWVGDFVCYMSLQAADGSGISVVGDGIEPALSPDGSRIAFVGYSQPGLFVLNLADGSLANVRNSGGDLAWSSNGAQLAFSDGELYVMNADGSNVVQVTNNVGFLGQPAWSPDGTIAFNCLVETGNLDICAINADGTGFRRLTFDPAGDGGPAFSPDGLTIAFVTSRYGQSNQIAVMNSNGTGVSQVGTGTEGVQPAWSPDGNRIAFVVPYVWPGGACNNYCYAPDAIAVVNRDGTQLRGIASGDSPSWGLSPRPFAQFVSGGCNGLNCTFDGSGSWGGSSPIMGYTWDFGDGTSGSGSTVTHAYAASGTYIVKLTVTDAGGVSNTQSQTVEVVNNVWPTASLTVACIGWRCTYDGTGSSDADGSIVKYYWKFGDAGDAETYPSMGAPIVTHAYTTAGPFTATLIVTDNGGATGTQRQVVNLPPNAPPVASYTATCTGLTCTFDASGSSDSDGTITSYSWNFADNTTGSGMTASHTYQTGGTYLVSLAVTDNFGATVFKFSLIAVNVPPVASFTLTCAALTCTFDGSASSDIDGTITSYAWSFGDNTTASGVTASHTYLASGIYPVSLTVRDNTGLTGVRTVNLAVSQPPMPSMHIGDLDRTSTNQQNTWTALVTITVHDGNHGRVANATVSGSWSTGGTASCTTDGNGQCVLSKSAIGKNTKSVTFTIVSATNSAFLYRSGDNHDPDGDSNGTSITVSNP